MARLTAVCLFCAGGGCSLCPPAGSSDRRQRRRKFGELGAVPPWATGGTWTQQRRAAAGLHPMGLPLLGGERTCAGCAHLVRVRAGRRFVYKCGISRRTRGAATDIRRGWPACTGYVDQAPE